MGVADVEAYTSMIYGYHDKRSKHMGDIPLPGLHQVEVRGIVLFIHEQLVHTNDTGRDCDHGQPGLPGLLLVAHIQLCEQLLSKALQLYNLSQLSCPLLSQDAKTVTLQAADCSLSCNPLLHKFCSHCMTDHIDLFVRIADLSMC